MDEDEDSAASLPPGAAFLPPLAMHHTHSHAAPAPRPYARPDCCGASIVTFFGPRPCRLCCRCCPPVRQTKSTKCLYTFLLVAATALLTALMLPAFQRWLQSIFRDFNATCTDLKIMGENCLKLTGYMAAFKVSFAVSFFFLCMSLLTALSTRSARSCIHNGFWFFKVMLILTVIVATFVVPISHLSKLHTGWIYLCLLGNWIFIGLQLACLIDFSNTLCNTFQRMGVVRRSWKVLEATSAFVVISLWLTMAIALFLIHGQQRFCLTKQFILIFNTGFCICLVLAALTPCARGPPNGHTAHAQFLQSVYASRLLQSGLVIVYITYWVWTAMQSSPETPGAVELSFLMNEDDLACLVPHSRFVEESLSCTAIVMMLFTICYINSDWMKPRLVVEKPKKKKKKKVKKQTDDEKTEAKTGARHRLMLLPKKAVRFCPIRKSKNTASTTATNSETDVSRPQTACLCLNENDSLVGFQEKNILLLPPIPPPPPPPPIPLPIPLPPQHIVLEPATTSMLPPPQPLKAYNYPCFHLILSLALMFATTQLTKWFQPADMERPSADFDRSWRTVLFKLCAAWSCGLGYLLYLLVPRACIPRRLASSMTCGGGNGGDDDGKDMGVHEQEEDEVDEEEEEEEEFRRDSSSVNIQEHSITLSHM